MNKTQILITILFILQKKNETQAYKDHLNILLDVYLEYG